MEKSAKPTVAGIFTIISGGLSVLGAVFVTIGMIFSVTFMGAVSGYDAATMGGIFVIAAVGGIVLALVTVAGGICALKRRIWGLALAGSILAAAQIFILGLPAIVLVAIARNEFE